MSDKEVASATNAEGENRYLEYQNIAASLARGILQGRAGFGAFRHFTAVFEQSGRLVLESGHFIPTPNAHWPFGAAPDPDFWHFVMRHGPKLNYRLFIQDVLGNPTSYDPHALWALFWAMAKAEHEFLFRYVPFWSHEERLTGHLVSQMIERLQEFGVHWMALCGSNKDKSLCRIWYADTATARRESLTGADLGVIIHAKFAGQDEFFKVVRFQAKKVGRSGSATIDLGQTEAMLQREHLGYYLFYHSFDKKAWSLAPTVAPASDFADEVEKAREERNNPRLKKELGSVSKQVRDQRQYDLATFITFAVADPACDDGVLVTDAREAASILMSPCPEHPSRVLVMTFGEGVSEIDWRNALGEYIGYHNE